MGARERLEALPFKIVPADFPGNAGDDGAPWLYLREMDAWDASAFRAKMTRDTTFDADGKRVGKLSLDQAGLELLLRTLCDRAGARLYGDEEIETLGRKLAGPRAEALAKQSQTLNRLGEGEEKNLPTPSGSNTTLPPASASATSATSCAV